MVKSGARFRFFLIPGTAPRPIGGRSGAVRPPSHVWGLVNSKGPKYVMISSVFEPVSGFSARPDTRRSRAAPRPIGGRAAADRGPSAPPSPPEAGEAARGPNMFGFPLFLNQRFIDFPLTLTIPSDGATLFILSCLSTIHSLCPSP